ncbi:MAG TPA: hypothetical protein VGI48_06700 [Caldimonas sp.]|jgi:hypothetical protein
MRLSAALIGLALAPTHSFADELNEGEAAGPDGAAASATAKPIRWNVELKRQNTDRATPDESTRTTLRLEAYPAGGSFTLLRLDLPFPDDKTTFGGDLFDPRPGDLKVKAKWRPFEAGGHSLVASLELTFPTARPESLGTGKVQVAPGLETVMPLGSLRAGSAIHEFSFAPLVRQIVSVAGDPDSKDINYTKIELAVRDAWRSDFSLKLTLKPVIDWKQDGNTAAVAELEGAWTFESGWHASLMGGARAWGGSVPSTYDRRLELTVGRRF